MGQHSEFFEGLSEVASMESALGDPSMEGFFTRMFNFDPLRLRSSWKRLEKPSRLYSIGMGTRRDVRLRDDSDEYTYDLVMRGNKVVTDLTREVLLEVSYILDSDQVLLEEVERLQKAIDEGTLHQFQLRDLPMFNRPLLGARSITGTDNEMDLIKQGNEIKYDHSVSHSYNSQLGYTPTIQSTPNRKNDIRAIERAGTYWDNRKTQDVIRALQLLRAITDRKSLIGKDMIRGGGGAAKEHLKRLLVWQEILYEHSFFLVHRVSRLLGDTN